MESCQPEIDAIAEQLAVNRRLRKRFQMIAATGAFLLLMVLGIFVGRLAFYAWDYDTDSLLKGVTVEAKRVGEIEKNYVALADDAAQVITTIDKLVAQADSKDGTLGLLLNDPQLYHNLSDTAERIKLMTDEARLLIEKWKAEGLPIRVFN